MSLTLRGRLELRLAASLLPLLGACVLAAALETWWPVKLAALMIGVGLGLDLMLYHRLLPYQPGWAALPLGVFEFLIVMGVAKLVGIDASLTIALALFWGSWLLAQVLSHAVFPSLYLSYAEDGGELGSSGPAIAGLVLLVFGAVGGIAWATQPPTIHLESGVHRGPLVLDHAQTLVGESGTVVDGGIVVTSDDVTIRDIRVTGGIHGIEVHDATGVVIEHVTITGVRRDGIHVRLGQVEIRDCLIHSPTGDYFQGIDISFSIQFEPSVVERCSVHGGREGIVTHSAQVVFRDNHVTNTAVRGIAVTEMARGTVEGNTVEDTFGVGIYCGDYSACEIVENAVSGTESEAGSDDGHRAGFGILSDFGAKAIVGDNDLHANRNDMGAVAGAELRDPSS